VTPEFVLRLGYAAGKILASKGSKTAHSAVCIGKDTRISGYMIESALEAGFSAAGVDVHMCGPIPTPAVAYLARALRLSAGIVISASHNPYADNGIKIFSGDGFKLPDEVEAEIEAQMDQPMGCNEAAKLGKVWRVDDAGGRYIEFCKSTFPSQLDLKGMRIVLDCAHGAAYNVAPHVFHELGADVTSIGVKPDGVNINDKIGATSPAALQKLVTSEKADLGIALDGDADRVVIVDGKGTLYDGDQLLYVIACHRARDRRSKVSGVAGTLMTNFAFEKEMAKLGIPFGRAKVGATSSAWTSTPPATASSPRCRSCTRCASRAARSPSSPRTSSCIRRCCSTSPCRAASTGRSTRRSSRRRRTPKPRSTARVACCCGPRAPSRCCA
jgi:phosphoglucosamine mutase